MKTLLLTLLTASLTLSAFGQIPSKYQKVRKMNVLADKKRFVLGLDRQDQADTIWRPHFAYVRMTEPLTVEQDDYLDRSLEAFETDALTDELDQEAAKLFDFDLGRIVFIPGPYAEIGTTCQQPKLKFVVPDLSRVLSPENVSANCDCGQTSTNWSCSGSCDASNSCMPTDSGCSIFFAYPCNGKCQ